jgi:replicative DNA helicase
MTNQQYPSQDFSDHPAPYSEEAEEAVLGAILSNPNVIFNVASFLKGEDFYILRHQYIWEAMQRIVERGEEFDYLTVSKELADIGRLDEVGGPWYLLRLVNNTPTSVHAEVYARVVERAAVRRRLMAAADEIKALALNEEMAIEKVTDEAEARLFSVTESQLRRDLVPISHVISEYWERMERLIGDRDEALGLPTGFRALDTLLGGLQKSDLLIFAGRPGMGKTSFMLSVALNAARFDKRIAIFTMEMGVEQIIQRMVSMETGINMQRLRLGQVDELEWRRLVEAMSRLRNFKIFIDDTPAMSPMQMRAKCRRLAREQGVDLIMVDYLQLMNAGGVYENNRVQEVSHISRNLKELARELNVPLFSAAQLSRAVEQRQDKRPQLSDLRESGSLEQDSDIVMFLYRDEVYNEATEAPNQADIIVAKHRNGPTGVVSLYFDKTITRFMDATAHNIDLSRG